MPLKNHLSLIKQMIADDEASIARLGKLPVPPDGHYAQNLAGKPRSGTEDRQLVKLCLERGIEGLRLKLDAMTDCLDHTPVKPRVAAPTQASQLSH